MAPFAIEDVARPSLAVAGGTDVFPVHQVYAVTRNYDPRAMKGPITDRTEPAIFTKAPASVVGDDAAIAYPPETRRLEPEVELVVALGRGGQDLTTAAAREAIFGYAVGLDMTRRDLQGAAREAGLPWDTAKSFPGATPISDIRPASAIGHPDRGAISLDVNGARVQEGDLGQMIWKADEIVAYLSRFFALSPGDLIFTGTPAGETIVERGDALIGEIAGVARLSVHIA